jgi:hypothetical protein
MNTRKRWRRVLALLLTTAFVAAPAAQARLDERGGAGAPDRQAAVRIVDAGGFSWVDAGIGAAAALGVVIVAGGTTRTVRKHSPAHT